MPTDPKHIHALRQKAGKLLSAAPGKLALASATDVQKVVHELSVHQIELEMQNEELRRSREELEESRSLYADLYDLAPVGYLTFDQTGIIIRANLTACGLLGVERSLLLKKPLNLFLHPESQDPFYLHKQKVLETTTTQSCQLVVKRRDGTVFDAQLLSIVVQVNGQPAVRSILTDITERKADEALRRYELLFQNSRDIVLLVRRGDGKILEANAAAVSAYGYDRDELLNLSIGDLRAKDADEMTADQLAQADTEGILFEKIHRRKDGSTFPVEVSSQGATVAGTRTVISVIRDIAQRKQAEEALRESYERFRVLAEATFEGIGFSEAGRIVEVNDQLVQMLGYEKNELIGAEVKSLVFPEDRPRVLENIQKGRDSIIEHRSVRKDGVVITVEAHGKHFTHEGRDVRVTALRDITERKRTEEVLQEYEKAVEGSDDMIVTVDRDYRYRLANAAFLKYRGLCKEEVIGRKAEEILGRDVFERVIKENLDKCFRGEIVHYEMKHTYPELGERELSVSYMPIRGPEGIDRVTTIIRDITERKRAEEALRESEARFRSVLDTSRDVIYRLNIQTGRYEYISPSCEKVVGFSYEQLMAMDTGTALAMIHPDDKAAMQAAVAHLEEAGEAEVEYRQRTASGGCRWLSNRMTLTRDIAGLPLYRSGNIRDVTEHRQAEEALRHAHDDLEKRVEERTAELQRAYDRLTEETEEREKVEAQLRRAQKMEALGTMAGGIAHDFNNMLAAIIGFTELLHDHIPEGSREARHTTKVLEAAFRGRELVRQMLTFSRRTERERKPLQLSSIVKESVGLLRASVPTTISIRTNVRSESGVILGDPVQIVQVVMNLATNAAYAMREKGGSLDIELSDYRVSSSNGDPHGIEPGLYMKLLVRDTGAGMSADIMEKIFDPFFTTKGVGEGTGLGLSVVMGIVKQSGGYIFAESELGKGSVFTAYFPKIAERPSTDTAADQHIPTGSERILFVDDEEALIEMGEELLAELGYEVICCRSSKDALALLQQDASRFDLVITDQTMPEMTGVQLAKEILTIRPDMPIIMCTGFSHQVDADTAKGAGIKAFAMKPLTKREIARTIRKVLEE